MERASAIFGVHVDEPNQLCIRAAEAGPAPVLRVAQRDERDPTPRWVLHKPTSESPLSWELPLAAGDFVVILVHEHAPGAVTIRFAEPAIVISVPPANDRGIREIVAFPCQRSITGNPKDPWPPPPPPPPPRVALREEARRWFDAQLLPLANQLPRGAAEPAIHALLVGIDHYASSRTSGRPYFGDLAGCVADIRAVEAYLRDEEGIAPERITTLVAPGPAGARPTYANIVAAWKRLIDEVPAGDQIYVHFSGHGTQAATDLPEVKGDGELDECIVPCDIDAPGGRYLRDSEIAVLVREMERRGQLVTLVMDSCHAGGLAKGRIVPRCGDRADTRPETVPSLVAPREALAEAARHLSPRGVEATPWSFANVDSTRATLLAACQSNELAYEYEVESGVRRGILTYFWLDVLRRRWPSLGYRAAHQRILAEVRRRITQQTPALVGDGDRLVLGHGRARPPSGLTVLDVRGDRIQVSGGEVAALATDTVLAIVPLHRAPEAGPLEGLPHVAIDTVNPTDAWAVRIGHATDPIALGDQAIVVRESARATHNVAIPADAAFDPLRDLVGDDRGLLTCDAARLWDLAVLRGPEDAGALIVADASGEPLPNQGDAIGIADPAWATKLLVRLRHLARFRFVRSMTNGNHLSPLSDRVIVELRRDRTTGGAPLAQPIRLTAGDRFYVHIDNRSRTDVHIAVLDFQPDWGISRLQPDEDTVVVPRGQRRQIECVPMLPPTWPHDHGRDVLKIFATTSPVDVSCLELDPIAPSGATPKGLGADNPLEELLAIAGQTGTLRAKHVLGATRRTHWTTVDIELDVYKPEKTA